MLRKFLATNPTFTRRLLARAAVCAVLLLTLSIAASAYTIVLRDGRRIEIASEFTLTKSTLTYEIAPGIARTVQLILIDVSATERANHGAPGSFAILGEQKSIAAETPRTPHAAATLTNRELQPIQQRRIDSESNYEKRRIQLGLPSIEESRRRQAQEEAATLAMIRERANGQARDEAYWRGRAAELLREILTVDAEMNYLRSRLARLQDFPLATHSLVTGVTPFVSLGSRSAVVSTSVANPGVFVTPRAGSVTRRGQVLANSGSPQFGELRPARPVASFGFPIGAPTFGFPIQPFGYVEDSYERANLSNRLDSLQVTHAGLDALWRKLEDEARDARVPQIWLEP